MCAISGLSLKVVVPHVSARERLIRLAIRLSREVLPDPLLPIIAVRLPLGMEADTLSRTVLLVLEGLWPRKRCQICDGEVSHIGGVVLTSSDKLRTLMHTGFTARRERLYAVSCTSAGRTSCFALNSVMISSFSMVGFCRCSEVGREPCSRSSPPYKQDSPVQVRLPCSDMLCRWTRVYQDGVDRIG